MGLLEETGGEEEGRASRGHVHKPSQSLRFPFLGIRWAAARGFVFNEWKQTLL